MPTSKPIPPTLVPREGIWISKPSGLTLERIPFDIDKLMCIPLSKEPWRLYRVASDQIEPINSDWHQISSAPGIHVAGKSYGTYRVAIDNSYIPWLHDSRFKFQPDLDPLKLMDEEVSVHGKKVARRNAVAHWFRDALEAISSRKGPGLDSCYRSLARTKHWVELEWAILERDLKLNPSVKTRFTQCLLFIALNLVDDYNTPSVLQLLEKDEEDLLQGLWVLHTDPSIYLPKKIANFKNGYKAELHRISLFRFLVEFVKGKTDIRQHNLDSEYTTHHNNNIYGSMLGISGPKPFGTFDSQKMLDALSKSPVFPSDTLHKLDIMKLSGELMNYLPIGIPCGNLDLPSDILKRLSYGQVQTVHLQIVHFYREHRSLQTPKNNVLVILSQNLIRDTAYEVLVEWATSTDGCNLYERILKDIQAPQTEDQLVLNLAALLCYQRLFLPIPDTNQPIKGSYQADFDAILNGERLTNARIVSEFMVLSILGFFYNVRDNEKMRTFLATVLEIQSPLPDTFHEPPDRYWIRRMEDGWSHGDAFKMAEELVGGCGEEKAIITQEVPPPMSNLAIPLTIQEEEMAQKLGFTTPDERRELAKTLRDENRVASPLVSNDKESMMDLPAFLELTDAESGRIQLDGYDFNSYTLVRVSDLRNRADILEKLGDFDEILSLEKLQDGSWELLVHKSYLPTLADKLRKMVPNCVVERYYDPTEPNTEEMEEFGYEKARILRACKFSDRVERMTNDAWPKAAAFYADLEMDILREQVWEKVANENTDECWLMGEAFQL